MWNRNMARFGVVLLMGVLMVNLSRCSDNIPGSTTDLKSTKKHVDPYEETTYREKMYNEIREKLCQPSNPTEKSSSIGLCIRKFDDLPIFDDDFSHKPILLCRSENLISLEWSNKLKNRQNTIYGVEVMGKSEDIIDDTSSFYLVKDEKITIDNLRANSNYSICLSLFNLTTQLGKQICEEFSTMPENFIPSIVSNVSIDYSKIFDHNIEISINWTPAEDRTCYYEIISYSDLDFTQTEVYVPQNMFFAKIDGFKYGTNYSVGVKSLVLQRDRESEVYWSSTFTPTCIEVYKNLKMCAPETPTGLKVTEENLTRSPASQDHYDIVISWNAPILTPDLYIINLTNTESHSFIMTKNITGTAVKARIEDVIIGNSYKVTLSAWSSGGISEPTQVYRTINLDSPTSSNLLWSILIPVLSIIFIIGLALFIYYCYKRFKHNKRRSPYFEELEHKTPKESKCRSKFEINNEYDPFEILPEALILYETLGEGAFGIVRRGWITSDSKEVAVKMLKDDSSAEEVKQFRQEINLMKSVGSHANIVSLVGCCTRLNANMMLIVEFCGSGDLQNYLRDVWNKLTSKKCTKSGNVIKYAQLFSSENSIDNVPSSVENKSYDIDQIMKNDEMITAVDLLSFARQVALGMEFLSSNRVIHRDLAARNILVCNDKTVKIADFGLSRDIYQENVYKKTDSGKLPIKWMALESLTHQVYTTYSDVWSFGVLFWEIATLGSNPYPSIPADQLLKFLKSGNRMECPKNCSADVYNVMMECWRPIPNRRPNFTEIRKTIETLMEGMSSHKYLSLDIEYLYKDIHESLKVVSDPLLRSTTNSKSNSKRYILPTYQTKNNLKSNIELNQQITIIKSE